MNLKMPTCRFCQRLCRRGIQYGEKHYAHPSCYLEAGKKIESLPAAEIRKFRRPLLRRYGIITHPAVLAAFLAPPDEEK